MFGDCLSALLETERRSTRRRPVSCAHALRCTRLELRISLEDQVADTSLRRDIVNRPQEREAAALPVYRILTRRERHVPAAARPALPNGEANELHVGEHAVVKCSSASASFPGGLPFSLTTNLTVTFALTVLVVTILSSSGTVLWFLRHLRNPTARLSGGREVRSWRRGDGAMRGA
jgi:hypothetical protein